MRTTFLRKKVLRDLKEDKKIYIIVALSLIIGTILGTVSSIALKDEQIQNLNLYMNNFFSSYSLQSVSKIDVFKMSLYNNIKFILLVWASGFFVILTPIAIFQIGLKGFKTGFSIAFLIKSYQIKGMLFAFISMLPQNIIIIPMSLVYTAFLISQCFRLQKFKGQGKDRRKIYLKSLLALVIAFLTVLLCATIEAYIIPVLVKPICSIFN